jgi:hypothetical protein
MKVSSRGPAPDGSKAVVGLLPSRSGSLESKDWSTGWSGVGGGWEKRG